MAELRKVHRGRDVAAALRAVDLALAVTLPTAEPLRERLDRDRARVLARLN